MTEDDNEPDEPSPCICDRCARTNFMSDEATWPRTGEWEGCTLCPDCANEID